MKEKPSEVIFKIFSELRQKKGGNKNSDKADAIIKYLDKMAGFPTFTRLDGDIENDPLAKIDLH